MSERNLISLPVKCGGMGIPILTEFSRKENSISVIVTRGLVDARKASISIIDGGEKLELKSTLERQEKYLHWFMEQRVEDYSARRGGGENCYAAHRAFCIKLVVMSFLSEIQIYVRIVLDFDMTRSLIACLISVDVDCRMQFDINHALNCHLGGFINIRHNEIRNLIGGMITRVQNDVQIEP